MYKTVNDITEKDKNFSLDKDPQVRLAISQNTFKPTFTMVAKQSIPSTSNANFSKYLWCVSSDAGAYPTPVTMWWVCVCRSKRGSGTYNSLTSSEMLFRVSSFPFETCCILLFPDAFPEEASIPKCSLQSEFAATLVASCPEDTLIDLTANSILGATMLSIAVKSAF